jgi:hypothetical protein
MILRGLAGDLVVSASVLGGQAKLSELPLFGILVKSSVLLIL